MKLKQVVLNNGSLWADILVLRSSSAKEMQNEPMNAENAHYIRKRMCAPLSEGIERFIGYS
jgi:hypothetical protein